MRPMYLRFGPSTEQAAEARFLRALSLYYLLDLYGQYPFRNPGDNLVECSESLTRRSVPVSIYHQLN